MAKIERHLSNGWFPARFFAPVTRAIHLAATEEHTHWFNVPKCKYVQLRIDQRSGDFNILNAAGKCLSNEDLRKLFPALELED